MAPKSHGVSARAKGRSPHRGGKLPASNVNRARLRKEKAGDHVPALTTRGGGKALRDPKKAARLVALINAALDARGISATQASIDAGLNRDAIRNIRRGSFPSATKLAALGQTLNLPDSAIREALRGGTPSLAVPLPGGSLPTSRPDAVPLPLRNPGRAEEGVPMDEVLGSIERPDWLENRRSAYALTVVDDRMSPVMRTGQTIYIDPARPAAAGDYVRVIPQSGETWLGCLRARDSAAVTLRALADDKDVTIPAKDVAAIHLIVGVLFLRL